MNCLLSHCFLEVHKSKFIQDNQHESVCSYLVIPHRALLVQVTDGELSSCRGRVLHVLYVPMRHVAKDAIKAKLEVISADRFAI